MKNGLLWEFVDVLIRLTFGLSASVIFYLEATKGICDMYIKRPDR